MALYNGEHVFPEVAQFYPVIDGRTPANVTEGAMWYDLASHQYFCIINGVITALGAGSSITAASVSTAYTFSVSGGVVSAFNNNTGKTDYSGTDAAVVINQALAARAGTGGRFYFKDGVYNLNSATLETAGAFGTSIWAGVYWYCIGLPSSVDTAATQVQFIFEGESCTVWQGESLTTNIQTNGVIFNVTAAAITAAGSNFLSAIWQRPEQLGSAIPFSNANWFTNICVRFPTNQRGNTCGFNNWCAFSVQYENCLADFNLGYYYMAHTGPVKGSIGSMGMTSTFSGSSVPNKFLNTFVTGYDTGYDFASEHCEGDTVTAIYCNYAGIFGAYDNDLNGLVYHPSVITKFLDQENLNGLQWGPNMQQGSRVDLFDLDLEIGNYLGLWYSRLNGGMVETNPGFTSGIITYTVVTGFVGISAGTPLFTSGGQNFTQFNSFTPTANPNPVVFQTPTAIGDSFTRANAANLGPFWSTPTYSGITPLTIVSNQATIGSSSATGVGYYTGIGFNSDQFSKATVAAIAAGANTYFMLLTNASTTLSVNTHYEYYVSGNASTGSGIAKFVAGSATLLASQTGTIGANAGDILELRRIGTTLAAYRNGVLDTNFSPNPVTDSSLTGGAPGIQINAATVSSIAATNWSGGSLQTGSDPSLSLFEEENIFTAPQFMTNMVATAATRTGATGQVSLGTTAGIGNGAAGNIQAPAKSTGTGPATPGTVVNWLELDIAGTKYWMPLCQ